MRNIIAIPYGNISHDVKLEHEIDILKSEELLPINNLEEAIQGKINYPVGSPSLKTLLKNKKEICIVASDNTRPVPNRQILNVLIPYILNTGIKREDITILVATGSHETLTNFQIIELFGEYVYKNFKILCSDCYKNNDFSDIGYEVDGTSIKINKNFLNADFKIITGLIEPHPFAGFSGGRKSVCPGLIDAESFKVIHGTDMVFSKYNEVGVLKGNRLHEIATEVALKTGVDFIINVSLNKERKVAGLFCGSLIDAFNEGVRFVKKTSIIKAKREYDLIITHGGGIGLDSYYYQLAKSINIATQYLKPGGSIVVFGKCAHGIGTPVLSKMLENANNWEEVIGNIESSENFIFEQWNVEFVYNVLKKAKVYLFSDVYNNYPFLQKFTPRVKDINKLISDIKKQNKIEKDIKIGFIEDGPFSI